MMCLKDRNKSQTGRIAGIRSLPLHDYHGYVSIKKDIVKRLLNQSHLLNYIY